MALAGLLTAPLLWSQMSTDQKLRVEALFDQPAAGERPTIPAAGQLQQAKRMAALGGPWGSLVSPQPTEDPAVYHLPEAGLISSLA